MRTLAPMDFTGASSSVILSEREIVADVANGVYRIGDGKTVGGIAACPCPKFERRVAEPERGFWGFVERLFGWE